MTTGFPADSNHLTLIQLIAVVSCEIELWQSSVEIKPMRRIGAGDYGEQEISALCPERQGYGTG